jgi:uncharacterized protein (TIGR02145 family)
MKTRIALIALLIIGSSAIHAQTIMNIHQSNGTVLQIPLNTIDSITYTINNPGSLASITTTAVTSITGTTAVSGGNITNDGGSLITQRGICYSTTPIPTTSNTTVIGGSGTGLFACNLTGLIPNTTYYVRAYAINSAGTAYGNALIYIATSGGGGIVSNPGAGVTFDGYTYSSVVLGNGQEWMVENLRTTVYANGNPIPNVTDNAQWQNLTSGAWIYYENNSLFENPYGKLYNWYTVNDPRNVCPTGWHVPSDAEWTVLSDYLGGWDVAGGKMKSTEIAYWAYQNIDATNESGFSGLPGGQRQNTFNSCGHEGYWWSSSAYGQPYALRRKLVEVAGYLGSGNTEKTDGHSVRCLRD